MVELNTINMSRPSSTRRSIPPINGSESVIVRNAYKKYESDELVLNGLNLTVAEGTIYALLGPSGCGKTTLLNCIVGQTALDAGIIRLKITKRSQLGYMPQFLSLHTPLSIYENFYFYGYIFDLSSDEIRARADRLISFLELPHGDCTLKTLSGGQQRRVSVAIAFLHQPKLLILDEPTVGLDPVLCQKIWMKLHDFIKEGASIVITTHYIQEARQAHTIGLMRGGVLLAEEKPESLLEKCECDNLEEAFLKLSHEQESKSSNRKTVCPKTAHPAKTYFEEDDSYFTRAKFFAIMYKNTIFLRREFVFIIFILVLPTVQAYIFNLVLGVKPKNLKLAVINEEIPYANCGKSSYDGCFLDSSQNVTISCLFLELLKNETYIFREYKNTEEALHDIRKNKVWAILNFPKNFTNSLAQRVTRGVFTDIEHIANSTINSWIDLSNQYIGSAVKYDVIRSLISSMKKALTICGENPKMGAVAVSFETPIFGSYNENFVTYASAAMICLCCFFSSSTSTSMLIVSEKSDGMVQRMIVAGATVFEMVFSLLLIQIIGQIISVPMVMMIMYWFFGNPMHGSITTLLSLLGLTGFTGVLYGTTLAVLNKDLIMTAYCGVGMNIVMCLTTGLLWPIEAEHYVLKNITWMLPLTWIADAARGISSKSYSFFHPTVFRGFASAIVWNCIFLYVIYFCLKYKKGAISRAT